MKYCPTCNTEVTKKENKFCNQSCAAKYNNRKAPKRKPEGSCRTCNKPIKSCHTWCSEECKVLSKKPSTKPKPNCRECGKEKTTENSSIYCTSCRKALSSRRVTKSRRNKKKKLVEAHGSQCKDCGIVGPSYIFDFDHKEPENKSFGIAASMNKYSFDDLYQETLKCDLVCALCHRYRTHLQRCKGCDDCRKEITKATLLSY